MTPEEIYRESLPMIRSVSRFFTLCAGCALMLGCATSLDIGKATIDVTPQQATHDTTVQGRVVAWGGVIVGTVNMADKTRLEVLAYPLDSHNRPQVDAKPVGRFLALYPGFLEPVNFAAGRQVTAVGTIGGTQPGTVGEARYLYPTLEASRVHLWPTPEHEASQPQFHFGVGIGITR